MSIRRIALISKTYLKDRIQDIWFAENGFDMIRITDEEYIEFGKQIIVEKILPFIEEY